MLELGISQAQGQFTQLLTQKVLIIDKKAHRKKVVILLYNESKSESADESLFSKFVGILDNDFKTNDSKYNDIVK